MKKQTIIEGTGEDIVEFTRKMTEEEPLSEKAFEIEGYFEELFEIKDVKEAVERLKATAPKDEIDSMEYNLIKEIDKIFGRFE